VIVVAVASALPVDGVEAREEPILESLVRHRARAA
jgi:hypothetical protein